MEVTTQAYFEIEQRASPTPKTYWAQKVFADRTESDLFWFRALADARNWAQDWSRATGNDAYTGSGGDVHRLYQAGRLATSFEGDPD